MKILVPLDFTPVTENAFSYAIQLERASRIVLFHVVDSIKDENAAMVKLKAIMSKYSGKFSGELIPLVKEGNIFDLIGDTALEMNSDLIVMGTHGVKGLQHILGSRAMKVITNSQTPYIVVQKEPFRKIQKILVPVDFTREVKQILPFLTSVAKIFKAELLLFRQSSSKDEFIENRIENNLAFFKSYLDEHECSYKLLADEFSASSRYKNINQEAVAQKVDMIVTTIDPTLDTASYIMGVEEQKIVANEAGIPVLCINIKHFMKQAGNIFEATA